MVKETSNLTKKINNNEFFGEVKKLLQDKKRVRITVVGKSMYPFLEQGDQVMLEPVKEKKLLIGDIVLASYRGKYILHRIIRKKEDEFMLAGDGNYKQIEKVAKSDIWAVVVEAYREGQSLNIGRSNIKGVFWYYLRFFRRLINKIINN